MIKKTVYFALHQPLFLLMMTILFVAGGVVAFKSLPIEAFPDVLDIQVAVITLFPGHAPEEVEKQVTIPLEIVLSGLPHQVRLFSHTQFGLSFVIITFDDRYNGYFARQQAVERLTAIDLPPGVQAQLAPFSTAIGEIYDQYLQSFADAIDGKPGFDPHPYTDRWGVWVTAACPICGSWNVVKQSG